VETRYLKGGSITKKRKIAFIGGDERMLFAAADFAADGADVCAFGFDINTERYGGVKNEKDLARALSGADVVALPLPYSADGKRIFAPFSEKEIPAEDVFSLLEEKSLLLGGKLPTGLPAGAVDYYVREDFAVLNAVPTAEGAVKLALEETKLSVCGMRAAVLGFGRVGKMLAKTLASLGADVTVFARSAEARAWAKAFYCKAKRFDELNAEIGGFDCIFNTVPQKVLFEDDMARINRGAVIIELASAPGGADASEAARAGVRFVCARGLPGKITPRSAGKIIYEIFKEIMEEI
jgi:dipicolinate synthase subunit A